MRYYLDTSIWRDLHENRSDRFRPLGEWALVLLSKIRTEKGKILVSDMVLFELAENCAQFRSILAPFSDLIEKISSTDAQVQEAIAVARHLKIPKADALHAVLSRDNHAALVARDRHFELLQEIARAYRPEELI